MTWNISENLSLENSGTGTDPLVQQSVEKLQGYNAGFEKAISTYQEIIWVLFLTQAIQVITHRFLYRDKPFAITLNHPISGEELRSWGSDKELEGRPRRIVKLIDNVSFTLGMALVSYLFIQLHFPAYTWEVTSP